jgi:YesN/AraC family two-component response regulator
MDNEKVKVVLADDNCTIRTAIRRMLEKSSNISVVGEASNGQEAIILLDQLSPDILILDIQMPVMNGFETMEILQKNGSKTQIIVLSGYNDLSTVVECMNYGAHSFVLKDDAPSYILIALYKAYRGENRNVSPGVAMHHVFA